MLITRTRQITARGRHMVLAVALAAGAILLGPAPLAGAQESTETSETAPASPSTRSAEESAGCWSRAGGDALAQTDRGSGTAQDDPAADQKEACTEEGAAAARSSNNEAPANSKEQQ